MTVRICRDCGTRADETGGEVCPKAIPGLFYAHAYVDQTECAESATEHRTAIGHLIVPRSVRWVRCSQCGDVVNATAELGAGVGWVLPIDEQGRCPACVLIAPLEDE